MKHGEQWWKSDLIGLWWRRTQRRRRSKRSHEWSTLLATSNGVLSRPMWENTVDCSPSMISYPTLLAGHQNGGGSRYSADKMGPRARHQAERKCHLWIKCTLLSHLLIFLELNLSGIFGRIPVAQQDCSMECSYQAINWNMCTLKMHLY